MRHDMLDLEVAVEFAHLGMIADRQEPLALRISSIPWA
jgi:hypothetical protein